MRIPRAHRLTLAYVEKFGLAVTDFTMNNPNAWCHLFGRKHRLSEVEVDPALLGVVLSGKEDGATCNALWERALRPFVDRLNALGDDVWPEIVAVIHPQVREEFEVGASKMWHDDPYAGGAFALFEPSQQSLLYQHIIAPEGRIHIAGEHASLHHAWIQGAIESGLRAASEINARN